MRLRKVIKEQEEKPEHPWTDTRERFTTLKPQSLIELKDSVMICPTSHRPYLSAFAKARGIKYTTISLGDGNIIVLVYSTKTKTKKV